MKFGSSFLRVLFVIFVASLFTYLGIKRFGSDPVLADTVWNVVSPPEFSSSGNYVTHTLNTVDSEENERVLFAVASESGAKVWEAEFTEGSIQFEDLTVNGLSDDDATEINSLVYHNDFLYASTDQNIWVWIGGTFWNSVVDDGFAGDGEPSTDIHLVSYGENLFAVASKSTGIESFVGTFADSAWSWEEVGVAGLGVDATLARDLVYNADKEWVWVLAHDDSSNAYLYKYENDAWVNTLPGAGGGNGVELGSLDDSSLRLWDVSSDYDTQTYEDFYVTGNIQPFSVITHDSDADGVWTRRQNIMITAEVGAVNGVPGGSGRLDLLGFSNISGGVNPRLYDLASQSVYAMSVGGENETHLTSIGYLGDSILVSLAQNDDGLHSPVVYSEMEGPIQGEGTEADPYLIDSCTKLSNIVEHDTFGYYLLTEDLVCTDLKPIASGDVPFGGVLDGGDHKLAYTLDTEGTYRRALIGVLIGGVVKDLEIDGTIVVDEYGYEVGGIAGYVGYDFDRELPSQIQNIEGTVDITVTEVMNTISAIGGLVGAMDTQSSIEDVDLTVDLDISTVDQSAYSIGGLVGSFYGGGLFNSTVSGVLSLDTNCTDCEFGSIGGLVGWASDFEAYGNTASVDLSVSGFEIYGLGGLIGYIDEESVISGNSVTSLIDIDSALRVERVGGLVGHLCDGGGTCEMADNTFSGLIDISTEGASYVGGVVGYVENGDDVSRNSTIDSEIIIDGSGSIESVGGFAGWMEYVGARFNKASTDITILTSGSSALVRKVGGFVGEVYDSNIRDSYSDGSIEIDLDTNTSLEMSGGFVGYSIYSRLFNTYSAGALALEFGQDSYADYLGGFGGAVWEGSLVLDSFSAHSMITLADSSEYLGENVGAFIGSGLWGTSIGNSAFYSDLLGLGICSNPSETYHNGCFSVEQESYFVDNNENAPLNSWNWETVWSTADNSFPVLLEDAEYTESEPEYEGSGEEEDPYIVDSCVDLERIAHYDSSAYYLLDGDMTCLNMTPVGYDRGESETFNGNFDGGGHKLTYSIRLDIFGGGGLFWRLNEATIRNLEIDALIHGEVNINDNVGALSRDMSDSTIEDITGEVEVLIDGNPGYDEMNRIGGLFGDADYSTVRDIDVAVIIDIYSYNRSLEDIGGIFGSSDEGIELTSSVVDTNIYLTSGEGCGSDCNVRSIGGVAGDSYEIEHVGNAVTGSINIIWDGGRVEEVGGLIGYDDWGSEVIGNTIDFDVDIEMSSSPNYVVYVGGLAGEFCGDGGSRCLLDGNSWNGSISIVGNDVSKLGGIGGSVRGGKHFRNFASGQIDVDGGDLTTYATQIGGLIGTLDARSAMFNAADVDISIKNTGANPAFVNIGGLIGELEDSIVSDNWSKGSIDIDAGLEYGRIGGFIGGMSGSIINRGYSAGSVNLELGGVGNEYVSGVGGFIGEAHSGASSVTDVFSASQFSVVNGQFLESDKVGGLIGRVGGDGVVVENSFFDSNNWSGGCIEGGDGEENVDCMAIVDHEYFTGNNEVSPLNSWDWETVWNVVTNDYPDFVDYPTAPPLWDGEGTDEEPYLVSTCAQFQGLDQAPTSYFELINNIDCRGFDFRPIGREENVDFEGTVSGNGYAVIGITINMEYDSEVAIFYNITDATIVDIDFVYGEIIGYSDVATLAYNASYSYIGNVNSNMDIYCESSYCGGLFVNGNYTTIVDSTYDGEMHLSAWAQRVGGLVVYSDGLLIERSHAITEVVYEDSEYPSINYFGGLAAQVSGDGSTEIRESSAYLAIIADHENVNDFNATYVGGLLGTANNNVGIYDSYADGELYAPSIEQVYNFGGLVGYIYGDSIIENSYSNFDLNVEEADYVYESGGLAGGFSTDSYSHEIKNSVAFGRLFGDSDIGGIIGRDYNDYTEKNLTMENVYFYPAIQNTDYCIGSEEDSVGSCYSLPVSNAHWNLFGPLVSWDWVETWKVGEDGVFAAHINGPYEFGTLNSYLGIEDEEEEEEEEENEEENEEEEGEENEEGNNENNGGNNGQGGNGGSGNSPSGNQGGGVTTGEQRIVLNEFFDYLSTLGVTMDLQEGQVIYFSIITENGEEEHSITITEVGEDYVVFTVRSDPQEVRLVLGESREVDANMDGTNDVEITLLSIDNGYVNARFKQLGDEVDQNEGEVGENTDGQVDERDSDVEKRSFNWWWIVVAVLVGGGLYIIAKRRREDEK